MISMLNKKCFQYFSYRFSLYTSMCMWGASVKESIAIMIAVLD